MWTTQRIADLVQPGRVHRDAYTDPALFDLEMERIFGRAWLLLGHDSQIPRAGDFVTSHMGRQPVVIVRQRDGGVKVLFNRCAHRGSTVCSAAKGTVTQFVCAYHGWTYGLDGALLAVPAQAGYTADRHPQQHGPGLAEVARTEVYRGFVFANLAADGPSLRDFLGPLLSSFDDLVDRAPEGEVEVAGGVSRHAYDGNWKFVLENHLDTIHPRYVHASSIAAANEQDDSRPTDGAGEVAVRQMRQNGAPNELWEGLGLWVAERGHGYMGDYHDDEKLVAHSDDPVHVEYQKRMEAAYGPARAREILAVTRWNSIVFPNVSFMSQFGQLRIVRPVAVGRTVLDTYVFRLKGAPDAMFRRAIAFANVVNGTGSPVLTDDLEVYERLQIGLGVDGNEWVNTGRGFGRDVRDESNGLDRGGTGTSEIAVRNQFRAWTDYMTRAGADAADTAGHGRGGRMTDGDDSRRLLRPGKDRGFPDPRGRPDRPARLRGLARSLHRRLPLLGAAGGRPGRPAGYGLVDLRRPQTARNPGAPARPSARPRPGAAVAHPPHHRQRGGRSATGGRADRRPLQPDRRRIPPEPHPPVRRPLHPSPGTAGRRLPHRLQTHRPDRFGRREPRDSDYFVAIARSS